MCQIKEAQVSNSAIRNVRDSIKCKSSKLAFCYPTSEKDLSTFVLMLIERCYSYSLTWQLGVLFIP